MVNTNILEKFLALRRRRSRHGASYRFGHLHRENADGGAATIDEYTLSGLQLSYMKQGMVGGESNASDACRFNGGDVGRTRGYDSARYTDVLCESALFALTLIYSSNISMRHNMMEI